jgi:hypothetical protein
MEKTNGRSNESQVLVVLLGATHGPKILSLS